MQAQRTELLSLLPEYGWRVASAEEILEWWADEMWLLEFHALCKARCFGGETLFQEDDEG
jgi:hypothetical protein